MITAAAPDSVLSAAEFGAVTPILVTSAQRDRGATHTSLVYGPSLRTTEDSRGRVHWVAPGQIVVYHARGQRPRTFVLRTLATPEPIGTRVPGVHRPVRLLVQTTTAARLGLLARFVRRLLREGRDPSALADVFYHRLDVLLSGRAPSDRLVRALLEHHDGLAKP